MNPGDIVAERYKLLHPIGDGAMGSVWAARHELLGRDFALKFAHVQADPESTSRFQREAQIVGKLRHPNIVDVTDFGQASTGGHYFLAMELLEGESLAECIEKHGPLDPYEAVTIAIDVARGLSAVHAAGLIHRDIKPENIFLARHPTGGIVPKLLDFGISKEQTDSLTTQHGALTGTPAYMSPELALGETKIDPRTDIWSLGVVLYEMLTGKHPFVAPNYQALMVAIAEHAYVPIAPAPPSAVRRIVDRCLQKRPADRFANSDAVMHALDSALLELAQPRSPRVFVHSLPRSTSSPPRRWLIVGVIVLVVIAAAFASWLGTMTHAPTSAAVSVADLTPRLQPIASSSTSGMQPAPAATSASLATTMPVGPAPSASSKIAPRTSKRPTTSVTDPGF